jgi:hypothetical protein
MPARRRVHAMKHPGSSPQDIEEEPDWDGAHDHRIGYCNKDQRYPEFTHDCDQRGDEEDKKFAEEAMRKYRDLREREQRGEPGQFSRCRERVDGGFVNRWPGGHTANIAFPARTSGFVVRMYIRTAGDIYILSLRIG